MNKQDKIKEGQSQLDNTAAASTGVLHANKNSQSQTCRPTDHFGMRWSDRKDIGICWQTHSTYC